MTDRPLPLTGITVLDLGQIYQGPYAGFLLAMAGARVIKIEPPQGEPLRARGVSLPFALLNSCKESITLDLKQPAGKDMFLKLARHADVVLCNFAPGVPERLGIDAESLWQVNERLVFAHASGFGLSGPDAQRTAMDITVQAHMGPLGITGYPDRPPVKSGAPFIDFLGGTTLYGAVATALFEVARTGQGRMVETSMAEATFFTLTSALQQWHVGGGVTPRTANKHAALGVSPYDLYECADGYVALIVVTNRQWRALVEVMGREDLLADERLRDNVGRAENMAEVDKLVGDWIRGQPRADVVAALAGVGVPVAEVREVDEVVRDRHLMERGFIQWIDDESLGEVPLANSPIRWHGSQLRELQRFAEKGADNSAVLSELAGVTANKLAELANAGVI